jgi:hypothetical protein
MNKREFDRITKENKIRHTKPTLTEWLEQEIKIGRYEEEPVWELLLDKIKAGEFSGL